MTRPHALGRRLAAGAATALLLAAACGTKPKPTPPTPSAPGIAAEPAPSLLFEDATASSGLDFLHVNGATGRKYLPEIMGSGGCALDFDADGHLDVFLVQSGNVPGAAPAGEAAAGNRLYRNRGDGTFEDATERAGLAGGGYGMGATCADVNGDGWQDIYVLNLGPNVLHRNRGDGTFEDVTSRAGVGDARWSVSASFFDAEADGDLDLYVANYVHWTLAGNVECGDVKGGRVAYCHPDAYEMAPDVYYENRGDGRFVDRTLQAGLTDTTGKGLGVVVADLDDDGDEDIYVANDSTPNLLYRNRGNGTFEEVGFLAGVAVNEEGKTEAGMGVDVGDANSDGRPDIFVTNLSREANALYLGAADVYEYATRKAGLYDASFLWNGFGTGFIDLDHDGDLDLHVVNGHVIDNIEIFDDGLHFRQPSQLFMNDGAARFTEVDARRVPSLAEPRVGRGSIPLDHDNDGDVDLVISYNGDAARLHRNVLAPSGHWIGFALRGKRSNRDGVGAKVLVEAEGRSLTQQRKAGSSYASSGDPRLNFGLGGALTAARVLVRWPSGESQSFTHLPGDRYWLLVEGDAPAEMAPQPAKRP